MTSSGRMAIMITDECISCHACAPECPNDAIFLGDERYEIDPGLCTECVGFSATPQCAYVCPIDVCLDDPERREPEGELFARAVRLHPERADELHLSPATSHFR